MKHLKKLLSVSVLSAFMLSNMASVNAETNEVTTYPYRVDNSALSCFPPIRDQRPLGSCAAFAPTYYQLTHMTGLVRNWDAKNDPSETKKFSPRWTYNLLNLGSNEIGGCMAESLNILTELGAPTWSQLPYNGDYRQLPTTEDAWRTAAQNKIDKSGYITVNSPDNSLTPVKSVNDPNLMTLKKYLNNGYVLTIETHRISWVFQNTKDDPNDSRDNLIDPQLGVNLINKPAVVALQGPYQGGHVMTVVGYDDSIWVDMNNNNIVDAGEKGAVKIANSWGVSDEENMVKGTFWFSYDAFNKVSSVTGATVYNDRQFGWSCDTNPSENRAYWITAKQNYESPLLARITINTVNRNRVSAELGCSPNNLTEPFYLLPEAPLYQSGPFAFNGTKTASDATIVLDYGKLIDTYKLDDGKVKRWYLKLTDTNGVNGNYLTLKKFELINSQGIVLKSSGPLNIAVDGTSIDPIPFLEYAVTPSQGTWTQKRTMSTEWTDQAATSFNGSIYVMGGFANLETQKTAKLYNPSTDEWTPLNDMKVARKNPGAATVQNKLYVVGGTSSTNSMEEFNPQTGNWTLKSNLNIGRSYMGIVSANNKLYAIGGYKNGVPQNTVEEYDPATDKWTIKASMLNTRADMAVVSLNGKIYAIGGTTYQNGQKVSCNIVEEYDPIENKWTNKTAMPTARYGLSSVTINNKIYAIGGFKPLTGETNVVEEYDPTSDKWVSKTNMQTPKSHFASAVVNNKAYIFGGWISSGISNTVEQFEK